MTKAMERITQSKALLEESLHYANRPSNWGPDHAGKLYELVDKLNMALGNTLTAFQKMKEIAIKLHSMDNSDAPVIVEEQFERAMAEAEKA